MKSNTIKWVFLFASVMALAVACKRENATGEEQIKEPSLPQSAFDYKAGVNNVSFFNSHGEKIDINNDIATLGRVLFYDKFMSINNAVSCGSCHNQAQAFSDPNRFSFGFAAGVGSRNAPAIFNLAAAGKFFWDGRSTDLQQMVLLPVQHSVEMGMESMDALEAKLSKIPYYAPLFKKAFGNETVTRENLSMALTQFLLTIRSEKTAFEQGGISVLTAEQKRGHDVFNSLHCQSCHGPLTAPYYNSNAFNIGLDKVYADKGMGGVNNISSLDGFFKAPSLRNLALTAPYMHDGRYNTLEEVIEHYNSGVINHPNLSSTLRVVQQNGWGNNNVSEPKLNEFGMPTLELTEQNKKDLVAFLSSITDNSLINDPKHSDPF